MKNDKIDTFNCHTELSHELSHKLSLEALGLGVNFDEHEQRNLIELASKIQNAYWDMKEPRDTEIIAQLLEAFANKVREGEI